MKDQLTVKDNYKGSKTPRTTCPQCEKMSDCYKECGGSRGVDKWYSDCCDAYIEGHQAMRDLMTAKDLKHYLDALPSSSGLLEIAAEAMAREIQDCKVSSAQAKKWKNFISARQYDIRADRLKDQLDELRKLLRATKG